MKTALVFSGSVNSILRQVEELNSYSSRYFSQSDEMEAWVLSDQKIDGKNLVLSQFVRSIKFVQVNTKHVAEEYLAAITKLCELTAPELMLFGSEGFVSSLAVRSAYRMQGSSCVGVRSNQYYEGQFAVEKLVYSNNLTAKFIMKNRPFCISIAKGFKDNLEIPTKLPGIEQIATPYINMDWLQEYNYQLLERTDELKTAKIVVAVGKGVGSKEKIALFEELAKLVGGRLGASRPVVMNAWTSMDSLIGASGSIISPEVCIAMGVSGAAAFAVGIEKSKFIIAINKDEKAPIFKIADVAVCAEYQELVEELIKLINQNR